MENILNELRSLAASEQPKNKSIAAITLFQHCKIILLLKESDAFSQWLNQKEALIDMGVMRQCGLGNYADNGYIMLNPRTLGSLQQQYLFFAFPRTANAFQQILISHNIDSLIIESDMTNDIYRILIGWPWAFA